MRLAQALADHVEGVQGLDRVAAELQPDRLDVSGREDVDDVAAHAELAAVLDQRRAVITPTLQARGESVAVDVLAFDQVGVALRDVASRRHALQQRLGRGDDDRMVTLAELVECLDARRQRLGGRRDVLEGRHLPAGEKVDAALQRRRALFLGEEEAQIGDQPLRVLRRSGDHQHRPLEQSLAAKEEVAARAVAQAVDQGAPRPTTHFGADALRGGLYRVLFLSVGRHSMGAWRGAMAATRKPRILPPLPGPVDLG